MTPTPRVLIAAEHASARFGGEAALPLHYFRVLKQRGVGVHLVTHARTRNELQSLYGDDPAIHYIEDRIWHIVLWRIGALLPARLDYVTTGFASRLLTQFAQRRLVRRIVRSEGIDVVHQPMPVSPREPSVLHGLGAPLVIGPMNGNMAYPPGFAGRMAIERRFVAAARSATRSLHRLLPGKLRAAVLLVANERTRAALPRGTAGRIVELAENGVDLSVFDAVQQPAADRDDGDPTTFTFMGRLVDWKRVDLLLRAFARSVGHAPMALEIVGDGDEAAALRGLARELGIADRVAFRGWLDQRECARRLAATDALVLPSILECGGAVVLEAMAMARPVVATAWGGPLDYLDDDCGILVVANDERSVVDGFAEGMLRLARSPALRRRMGEAGRARVLRSFDWEVKVDRMLDIYRTATTGPAQSLPHER